MPSCMTARTSVRLDFCQCAHRCGYVGPGRGERSVHSQFVLSPNREQRGVASRVVGATFFFLLGAIAASALYPRGDADSGGSDRRPLAGPTLAKAATDGLNASSARDSTEYTGGPIPEPAFTTQAVDAVGEKETQALLDDDHSSSAAKEGKPGHTANKPMRKQEYNHRRNAIQNRQYREQPSTEAARIYWNPWDWGNRFGRPFAMSR